ncbi:hypothetical protein NB77_14960 [Listeria monocytogenes]|uniref:hypothetical protein n=1 Tax=Listeria monocytogenes TaxID=1639 RepID=UPI0005447E0E|nr:hypothetical protein [Listeria monocytogenes]AKI44628.1 hypothetical protein L2676_02495 [Listeria monocytogenes]EAA0261035.1 hypothetical protein [Listeria monocytogenes]EAA0354124.1 hypothetical protein [Listeria monocytogenes]EAA0389819.1 hypothetical protein [Listeria monocytogenes]EAA0397128.1 hypothetical protein [Listeria monocytogenes]
MREIEIRGKRIDNRTREEVYHLHRVLMQDIILSTWGVSTKDQEDEEAFLAHIELSKGLARKVTRSEVK